MVKDVNFLVEDLVAKLKRRQITGSYTIALETAKLLRQIISVTRWSTAGALIDRIKQEGCRLVAAQPKDVVVANIVRRVLHIIREVYTENRDAVDEDDGTILAAAPVAPQALLQPQQPSFSIHSSMFPLLGDHADLPADYTRPVHNLKSEIIQEIQEYIEELENMYSNVSSQAMDHIHSNEVIMTCGYSKTVESFLKFAAKKRKFKVIVAECAPTFQGHQTALALTAAGIDTTVIPDASVFAMMARVNKVILGTSAILANGGLIALSGTQTMVEAAKHHSIPVIVCAGLFKLSPVFPFDEESLSTEVSPDSVLDFTKGDFISEVEVINPFSSYVDPSFIDLFITNLGGHPPSYLYRLLNENYDAEDTYLLKS
ncbi:GCD complex subunit gcd7 [Dimargaris cristalligena]|nr:GCD complex subunit gcd7 [Dimargaris cristalligena]